MSWLPVLGHWPTVAELADACELSEEDVYKAHELGRIGDPRSLDESLETLEMGEGATLSECVGHEDEEFDLSLDRMTVAKVLDTLPPREKTILTLRFYKELSQKQIAERINMSQMHVSRLERSALQKLRMVLQRSSVVFGASGRPSMTSDSHLPAA